MSRVGPKFELMRGATVVLLFVTCACSPALAEWIWDSEMGWVDMSVPPAQTDRGLYAFGKGFRVRGDYAAALEVFSEVGRKFPDSPYAARARLQEAYCEASLGRDAAAARIVGELLAQRSPNLDANELARFQLEIGRRTRDSSEAESVLGVVASLAPDPELRSEAQRELAERLFAQGKYDEARENSELALAGTNDSTARAQAMFLSALSDLAAGTQGERDESRLLRARNRLKEILATAPNSSLIPAAQECLRLSDGLLNETESERRAIYLAAALSYGSGRPTSPRYFAKAARKYDGSPAGEAARYYQADCLFRSGELWAAFKVYQRFVEEYPVSARTGLVIEREFAIGRSLEDAGSLSKAKDVMSAVAHNNPVGALADDAYMSLGRANIQTERFAEARDMFDAVVQSYPGSEWVNAAAYYGGVADLRHSEQAGDREMLLARSRRSLELYLRNAPDGPFAEEARTRLDDCVRKQAQDMMEIARFYERRKQPLAAQVYYREVVREYPGSDAAAAAQAVLGQGAEGGQP